MSKGAAGHVHKPCAWNTHAHTTDVHARRHFVHSKDKDTVSPHPHITTHKHANRSTHTGGCCVAPTSTCGVFSFCLFWGRKTNRFSSPQPLEQPHAPQPPAGFQGEVRSPQSAHTLSACPRPSAHSQPGTLPGSDLIPCYVQTRDLDFEAYERTQRIHFME